MFLTLSKTLDWLLSPLSWAVLCLIGSLYWKERVKLARSLIAIGLAILLIFSNPFVADSIAEYVEVGWKGPIFRQDVVYDAAIVLGGGLEPLATKLSGKAEFNDSSERIIRGFEMLKRGNAKNVILSAGNLDPKPGAVVEAYVLAKALEEWGIEPDRIVAEANSRNTRENAIESQKIIQAKGWKSLVLITSASHVPRALGCFHAVGLRPDVLPVDFHGGSQYKASFLPKTASLDLASYELRELFGRIVYRIVGYSQP